MRAGRCPPAGGCGGGAAGHQRERQPGVFLRHGLSPIPPTHSGAPLHGSVIAVLPKLLLATGAPALRAGSISCKPHTASLACEGRKQQRSMPYVLSVTIAWCTGGARPPQPSAAIVPNSCGAVAGSIRACRRPAAAKAVGGRSCACVAPMAHPCSRAQASSGRSLLQRELLGEKGHYGHMKHEHKAPMKHEHKGHYGALLPACLQASARDLRVSCLVHA